MTAAVGSRAAAGLRMQYTGLHDCLGVLISIVDLEAVIVEDFQQDISSFGSVLEKLSLGAAQSAC